MQIKDLKVCRACTCCGLACRGRFTINVIAGECERLRYVSSDESKQKYQQSYISCDFTLAEMKNSLEMYLI